jgi:hypothetical protein
MSTSKNTRLFVKRILKQIKEETEVETGLETDDDSPIVKKAERVKYDSLYASSKATSVSYSEKMKAVSKKLADKQRERRLVGNDVEKRKSYDKSIKDLISQIAQLRQRKKAADDMARANKTSAINVSKK